MLESLQSQLKQKEVSVFYIFFKSRLSVQYATKKPFCELKSFELQLNLHEIDPLFWYLSHHLVLICSIWTQNCFVIVSEEIPFWIILDARLAKLFRNDKNNFALICSKFIANLCKSYEILNVKWLHNYRKYGSISYSFSWDYAKKNSFILSDSLTGETGIKRTRVLNII